MEEQSLILTELTMKIYINDVQTSKWNIYP